MVSEPKVTLVCVMVALPEPVVIMLPPATTLVSIMVSVLPLGTGKKGKNGKPLPPVVVKEMTPALVEMLLSEIVFTPVPTVILMLPGRLKPFNVTLLVPFPSVMSISLMLLRGVKKVPPGTELMAVALANGERLPVTVRVGAPRRLVTPIE